jgi:hypothetical protein
LEWSGERSGELDEGGYWRADAGRSEHVHWDDDGDGGNVDVEWWRSDNGYWGGDGDVAWGFEVRGERDDCEFGWDRRSELTGECADGWRCCDDGLQWGDEWCGRVCGAGRDRDFDVEWDEYVHWGSDDRVRNGEGWE